MKIYKNSTFILGSITIFSFLGVYYFPVGTWWSNVLFSIFGSSLVSFALAWIYYQGEHERNIISLLSKTISIYHLLHFMKNNSCSEKRGKIVSIEEMEQIVNELKGCAEILKGQHLMENLQNFVVLWKTKESEDLCDSLWFIQMDIINSFSLIISMCTQSILKIKLAKFSNNLKEQEENYQAFVINFNHLCQLLRSHVGVVEATLKKLLKYGYLSITFEQIQKDIQRQ